MNILIVDDEQLARQRLLRMLADIGSTDYQIQQAENGLLALELVEQGGVDVVLLDIRMPVMGGLETARHLLHVAVPPAVIFTTSYEQHALQAFSVSAVDYLLKPVRQEQLVQALQKVSKIDKQQILQMRESAFAPHIRTHLRTTHGGRTQLVPVSEVDYFKAAEKYVALGWSGGELFIDEPLKHLAVEFAGQFIRVHRNALVNTQQIRALEKRADGCDWIILQGEDKFVVSRRHLPAVRKLIKDLS